MQAGSHLAFGILLLWLACVGYYVAFTMGHDTANPGYLKKTETLLSSRVQGQTGTGVSATSVSLASAAGGSAQALGLTEGGGV